jgi:peroxiredoxin (alkyl hydroperoxide reductase subunit C)
MAPPRVGEAAPALALEDEHGQEVSLADFRGRKNVLLVFFPFAFSSICTEELGSLRDDLGRYQNDRVQVLAVSCDPMFTLRAWAEQEDFEFPLLSDFWPHGEVARAYRVFHEQGGFATRGTFLVDRGGVVRWSLVHEPGEARDLASCHQALADLG